ncbi:MAG: hypothetical protein WCX46_04035, partial [Candidatus Paceibacterota bacterium]
MENYRFMWFTNTQNKEKAIELFNYGYSNDYVANVFKCKVSSVSYFKTLLKKKGVKIKNLPKSGGIKIEDVRRCKYLKFSKDPEKVRIVIGMLSNGCSFKSISKKISCHWSSIIAFYQKKLDEGYVFNRNTTPEPIKKDINKYIEEHLDELEDKDPYEQKEKINKGKMTYRDYSDNVKRKMKEDQKI